MHATLTLCILEYDRRVSFNGRLLEKKPQRLAGILRERREINP
jgi:hypothetical protein